MVERKSQLIADRQREAFAADGVVKITQAVDASWVDRLLAVAQRELLEPGDWVSDTNPGGAADRMFSTRYLWRHDPTVRDFVFESGIAELVGDLVGSTSMRFYFDHLLVKEPDTSAPTPWHQDIPYWPFLGKQIASAWVALTPSTVAQSSLEFVRGSSNWDAYYAPESFDPTEAGWTADFEGEKVPDIDAARADYDIVGFDVEPGDALIFSSWTLHGAPGNSGPNRRAAFSTRWLGDDARWSPHPGCDPIVRQRDVSVDPGAYPADDDRFPLAWSLDSK
ncbi:MAG: phytanoyl-CoA dioxygenase family protein [Acidimicrobiia bacterium]|nr:phytanoyl-CoA dioxygenase family protein [Acidimicrobiia bacterium]